jgi:hypothetical protein
MTRSGARLILASTAASCAAFLLCLPQPVPPSELPGLSLDSAAAAAALAEDEALAARAPHDATSERLRALGAVERRARAIQSDDQRARRAAADAVRAAHGEEALAALRAEAADLAEEALAGALGPEAAGAALGTFPALAERYGLLERGAKGAKGAIRVEAPRLVVRALFEAQWNTRFGLGATEGMSAVEEQAYWGWLALEARDAPVALRESALDALAEVGGEGVEEARAALAFARGDYADAFLRYKALYEATGVLRFRNHATAAERRL